MLTVIIGVVALAGGFAGGFLYRKKVSEKEISSAEEEGRRIVNEAIRNAESKKKEALLEAKEEILKSRTDYEKEEKSRRADLQRQENRLQQKEENLDRKLETIEKKEESLAQKHAAMEKEQEEIRTIKQSQTAMLEKISGFTADEAKEYLMQQVESEVTHETALKIKEVESRMKEECETRAREVVAQAIQRCAADSVAELTVSVVPLPNDEMKGRIIGREGRNIRTIETLTGVDLIIDDTPEAITVSCFETVRREIARLALEKLIADGRIHPTHIEEMVEKARREVEATIKAEGERAMFECGIRNLHPELVKMLGRLHYRTSYGQNVLQHSIEVSHIAGMMAAELGADVQTARWRAPMCSWAWNSPGSTRRRKRSSTPSRPTTTMWSPGPSWLVWCRRQTLFLRPVPAPGARIWRTTSSGWSSLRASPPPSRVLRRHMPFRPAVRSVSW